MVCRKDSAIGIYFIVETKANSINSLELEILVEKQSEIGGIMKRKNDMFKAFMAYKYFMKEKKKLKKEHDKKIELKRKKKRESINLNKWKMLW